MPIKLRKEPYKISNLELEFFTAFFASSDFELFNDLYVREYPALGDGRRFDIAFPFSKVLVEIQGGIFNNGKYNKGSGIASAHDKNNQAAYRGWSILFFNTVSVKEPERVREARKFVNERIDSSYGNVGMLEFYKTLKKVLPISHNPAYNENYQAMIDDIQEGRLRYMVGPYEVKSIFTRTDMYRDERDSYSLSYRAQLENLIKEYDNKGITLNV